MEATLKLENKLRTQGFKYIIGVDESGRGALCSSVVAAAVHIPDGFDISGINDSKKLSKKNREKLFERITSCCPYSIGMVSEKVIDKINIKQASLLAMKKAILNLDSPVDFCLIDGDSIPSGLNMCAKPVIGGDGLSVSIASASVIAKVFRDNLMEILHTELPQYGWDKNRGYGTPAHIKAIRDFGVSVYHRKTFGKVKEYC